ncbi:MAG TPA: ribose-5-phosphate isomerase RpiA [Pseudomonadota bacterium]|nr:ribose-5-phosphate isomerase RpiA [Pseudomonadota bacterium]
MQFAKPWEGPVTPEGISAARDAAARNAAGLVCEGMTLGLGTGDTAERWIRLVAERKHKHLKCVATSQRSAKLAESLGLALVDLDEMLPRPPQRQGERSRAPIDLTVDGADEIDRWLQLSKGGGGALLREKLVAQASSQVIILVDETKCVDRIGQRRPLAIEVVRFGATQTLARIATLPQVKKASIRKAATDSESVQNPFVTDSGNVIVDAELDPGQTQGIAAFVLHESLKLLPGVVETGLFCTEASCAILGHPDGIARRLFREETCPGENLPELIANEKKRRNP